MHVGREDYVAKFWIDPVRLVSSGGFRRAELWEIERVVVKHQTELLEAWNGFVVD